MSTTQTRTRNRPGSDRRTPLLPTGILLLGTLYCLVPLVWVVVAGLVVFAVNSALDVILTRAWGRVGQQMVYDLSADLFAHVQRRSLLFHSRSAMGDLMSRISGDCWCVYKLVEVTLFTPLFAVITIIGMAIVMAALPAMFYQQENFAVRWWLVGVTVAAIVILNLIAAFVPARKAATVPPVVASRS